MAKRTDEERAARKKRRRQRRRRTWRTVHKVIVMLVGVAEQLFPESDSGSLRHGWVTEIVRHIETPAGDVVEAAVINYLIELAVDEL